MNKLEKDTIKAITIFIYYNVHNVADSMGKKRNGVVSTGTKKTIMDICYAHFLFQMSDD